VLADFIDCFRQYLMKNQFSLIGHW